MALRITFSMGAPQQFGIVLDGHRLRAHQAHFAPACLRFERRIGHHFLQQSIEARLAPQRIRAAFGARDLQQTADQRIEPLGFLVDAVEMRLAILPGPRQLHGHPQARQRRAQLMGDIQQQPALGVHQRLDEAVETGRHDVEDREAEAAVEGPFQAAAAFMYAFDREALAGEKLRQQGAEFGVVVD